VYGINLASSTVQKIPIRRYFIFLCLTTGSSVDQDQISVEQAAWIPAKSRMSVIENFDIQSHVIASTTEVFDKIWSKKLEVAEPAQAESLEGVRHVGSVSFTGDVNAVIRIHIGDSFARELAANRSGPASPEVEGDEKIGALLGELNNFVGGRLKSAFGDAGLTCRLSPPSFTTGTDFEIEPLEMEKYERFAFRCEENVVFVEMGLKRPESLALSGQADADDHTAAGEPEAGSRAEIADPETQETAAASDPGGNPTEAAEEKLQASPSAKRAAGESHPKETPGVPEDFDLDLLLDIPLEIKVELGRAKIKIHDLLKLGPGSAIKLLRLEGEPVDILANDTLIARGEVVVQKEKYGIRVTEITSRMDRIRSFGV